MRNLSFDCTEDELHTLFAKFGDLSECHLSYDKKFRRSKGFAFITYLFPNDAVVAFNKLDKTKFKVVSHENLGFFLRTACCIFCPVNRRRLVSNRQVMEKPPRNWMMRMIDWLCRSFKRSAMRNWNHWLRLDTTGTLSSLLLMQWPPIYRPNLTFRRQVLLFCFRSFHVVFIWYSRLALPRPFLVCSFFSLFFVYFLVISAKNYRNWHYIHCFLAKEENLFLENLPIGGFSFLHSLCPDIMHPFSSRSLEVMLSFRNFCVSWSLSEPIIFEGIKRNRFLCEETSGLNEGSQLYSGNPISIISDDASFDHLYINYAFEVRFSIVFGTHQSNRSYCQVMVKTLSDANEIQSGNASVGLIRCSRDCLKQGL